MNPNDLLLEAQAMRDMLLQDRRHLHTCPGTGFDLQETLRYVNESLQHMGYAPRPCGKAGLIVTVGGKHPGGVFLLRADMDALPIAEQSDADFRSENGKMHACGHDCHTAMLLGAARLLKLHESEIHGTVKLMFQPAEEVFEGAKDMLANGLLEDPCVDAAMMIHVAAALPLPAGTVIVSAPGVSAPAADYFEIKVQGAGCHGSSPNSGVDPLTAAAHILLALQEIHARELSVQDRAVLTIGSFHGGTAANAIPDTAVLGGTIRTFDETVRQQLKTRLTEIAQAVATAFRASAEVTFGSGCPALFNDAALSADTERYLTELLGPQKALSAAKLPKGGGMAGSEDFAYVSQQVPALMLALAAGEPQKGFSYPQHHPKVKFDEDALPTGSAVYVYTAMRWLEEHP